MEGRYQSGGLLGRNGESETHIKEHGKAELAARKWHMAGPAGRLPSAVQGPVLRCALLCQYVPSPALNPVPVPSITRGGVGVGVSAENSEAGEPWRELE